MAEFMVTTDLRPYREAQISANFDEMEVALSVMLEPYRNMVVTEDGIKAAKADRAKINQVAKKIDEVRLATKRDIEAPIKDFEAKCNRLKGIAQEASGNLDRQIKGFEEQTKQAKLDRLEAFWDSKADDEAKDFVSFFQLREKNPKWVNASYPEETAQNDIMRMLATIRAGLVAIRNMRSPNAAALLDVFRKTHDLREVVELDERLKSMRSAEIERAKARQWQNRYAAPDPQAGAQTPAQAQQDEDEIRALDFRVFVTRGQLASLKAFLVANGIRYGKVPPNRED